MDKEPIPYPLLYGADVRRILASRDAEKPVAQKSAIGSILASTACAEWDRDKPTGVVYSDEALSSNDGRCQESLYQTRSQLSIGDTADNRDVVIGGLQEDLRLKNVPEIVGRVVPVDMNEALMTIVSPDNYRGGAVLNHWLAARVSLGMQRCRMAG